MFNVCIGQHGGASLSLQYYPFGRSNTTCLKGTGIARENHFGDVTEMVAIGSFCRCIYIMGFTLDEIARIKETARCYGLKRVVLFPCNVNGRVHSFFRMYEGNIEAFCVKLGIARFSDSISASEEALIDELIKTYGIIVYERD